MNKEEISKKEESVKPVEIEKPFSVMYNEFHMEMYSLINKHQLDAFTAEILLGRIYLEIKAQATNQFKNENDEYQKKLIESIKEK